MRRLLVILVLAGVITLLSGSWLDQVRASTATPSAKGLHAFATTTPSGRFAPYPRVHKVVCVPPEGRTFAIVVDYVKSGLNGLATATRSGAFRLPSGVIHIDSDVARYESTLPAGMRPDFDHALRHEYGHAFLYDFLAAKVGYRSNAGMAVYNATATDSPSRSLSWPAGLRAVVAEYLTLSKTVYSNPYYTSSLSEYVAESYARYAMGDSIPPATKAFLSSCVR